MYISFCYFYFIKSIILPFLSINSLTLVTVASIVTVSLTATLSHQGLNVIGAPKVSFSNSIQTLEL